MNSVIDQAALDNLLASLGGDKEFLVEIIDTYLDDSPKQIAAMHQAMQVSQPNDLRRAAHSLKSNSANLGATALAAVCLELETLAKQGTTDGADAYIKKIETLYAQVKPALMAVR